MKIDIIVPTYNEQLILEKNIKTLRNYLKINFSDIKFNIIIADNGSKDKTINIAKSLSKRFPEIKYFHLEKSGRGNALKYAWKKSKADICAYMDVDLSAGIENFPQLIKAISDGADIAIGSRYLHNSIVERSLFRSFLSRYYNILLKYFLKVNFSDGQCGFKALNNKIVKNIIPKVKDNHWFFDTEMLYLAEKSGYKIKEIPISWVETRNKYRKSKVKIIPTVMGYLWSITKLKFRKLK